MSKVNHEEIINFKINNPEWGSRAIAAELGCNKSTVNRVWAAYKQGTEVASEEQQDTQYDFDAELEAACNSSDEQLANYAKRLRTAQKTNTQLRRAITGSVDQTEHFGAMVEAIGRATDRLSGVSIDVTKLQSGRKGVPNATAEILFSDFQIGKVGQYYDSAKAEMAIKKFGEGIMEELSTPDFNIERIVFASLGDTVEDHLKHGVQSATSTDSGLAEQMARATAYIWEHLLAPLGALEIPMDVICIAGNHGSSQHKGMDMYKAGLYSYDYPIYKALEGYCKVMGWDHVRFIIPEGVFAYTTIYGRTAVYEHGYFNTCTEKSVTEQKYKRGQQLKRHVDYFRCGDLHHICDYNNGQEVVNGAFFGIDTEGVEYSGIIGFSSTPAQKMMIHTDERSIGRNTIKRNINIQVADGY